jgi:DNA-binding PadR family transcriptional regulator
MRFRGGIGIGVIGPHSRHGIFFDLKPRRRRGEMKFAILELLSERPRHGYDVLRELEARREGYRASAGSVYPTLQMLEEGGFVTSETVDGNRSYSITDSGRALLKQRPAEAAGDDEDETLHDARHKLRDAGSRLAGAISQAAREGDLTLVGRVCEILDKARREIYLMLGEAP